MAIKLFIEDGATMTLRDENNAIVAVPDLESIFGGRAYIDKRESTPTKMAAYNPNNMLFGVTPDEDLGEYPGNYKRIKHAVWIDAAPPTSFHTWVLGLMNRETPNVVMQLAEGEDVVIYNMWDVLATEYGGFEEAVTREIKNEGLEFVFGDSFDMDRLFRYIVREIVREYLREHNLYGG